MLLLELALVRGRDLAGRHAGRAAVAVGMHVAQAGLARAALGVQGARKVQLRGEVAVLEVGEGGGVVDAEGVLRGVAAIGDASLRLCIFLLQLLALLVFEAEEAGLFFDLVLTEPVEAGVLQTPFPGVSGFFAFRLFDDCLWPRSSWSSGLRQTYGGTSRGGPHATHRYRSSYLDVGRTNFRRLDPRRRWGDENDRIGRV